MFGIFYLSHVVCKKEGLTFLICPSWISFSCFIVPACILSTRLERCGNSASDFSEIPAGLHAGWPCTWVSHAYFSLCWDTFPAVLLSRTPDHVLSSILRQTALAGFDLASVGLWDLQYSWLSLSIPGLCYQPWIQMDFSQLSLKSHLMETKTDGVLAWHDHLGAVKIRRMEVK